LSLFSANGVPLYSRYDRFISPVSDSQSTAAAVVEPLVKSPKLWMPRRVVFTADALNEPFGQAMYERISALNLPIEVSKNNRITGLRGVDERETYRIAKNTLAVVNAPPGAFRLQPIPPSADWQMNLAEGCPAHCHYCYLAGSLSGPPVVRAYANLPKMLEHTATYEGTYPPNKTWQAPQSTMEDCARQPLRLAAIPTYWELSI
jgi:spore photoproduct lyase